MITERTFENLVGEWTELELLTRRQERGIVTGIDKADLDHKERLHRALGYLSVRKGRERERARGLICTE